MKNLEKELCKAMHKFVSEHIDEVTVSYDSLGFKDSADMLKQIESDVKVAIWALMELLDWGLAKNYRMDFLYQAYATDDDADVYCIEDSGNKKRFFIFDCEEMRLYEVKAKKMKVEVVRWVFK